MERCQRCDNYWLDVGTTAVGFNIFGQNVGLATSQTVTGLPTGGSTIYVRLWTLLGGQWQYSDYTYKAARNNDRTRSDLHLGLRHHAGFGKCRHGAGSADRCRFRFERRELYRVELPEWRRVARRHVYRQGRGRERRARCVRREAVADRFPIATTMNGTSMKITMGGKLLRRPHDLRGGMLGNRSACRNRSFERAARRGYAHGELTTGTAEARPSPWWTARPASSPSTRAGTGAAIIQNYNSATELVINTLATAAKPGQYAIAWGTGLGPDGHSDVDAPQPTDIPVNLELYRRRQACHR